MIAFFAFSLKRKASLAFLCIFLLCGSSGVWADSRLQALLGLGGSTGFFQDIDFKDKGRELDSESGNGILFDWALTTPDSILSGGLSNHAVAVDYYSFGEEEDQKSIQTNNLFVGYRYHFLSNFYLGASLALASDLEWDCGPNADLSASSRPLAYTLGYTHTFPFGLSLGVHYFNSLASDYELDDPALGATCGVDKDLEDVTLSLIGLTVGINF